LGEIEEQVRLEEDEQTDEAEESLFSHFRMDAATEDTVTGLLEILQVEGPALLKGKSEADATSGFLTCFLLIAFEDAIIELELERMLATAYGLVLFLGDLDTTRDPEEEEQRGDSTEVFLLLGVLTNLTETVSLICSL